ncbi:MAG: shikimate kinase [Geminicoccaceae bacterium]|nr:shikimate kinase [Geminicoccaceae bacterium]
MPSRSSASLPRLGHAPGTAPTVLRRSAVLVGLMGAGKTAVGRRLAQTLGAPFVDADDAIVEAAGMTIPDIFEVYGEAAFRDVERRVVARLLDEPPHVLALGGGAFVDPATRARVKAVAFSVWLKADLDTLVQRTAKRRAQRPLLMQGDPRLILSALMDRRHPLYAEADATVETGDQPPEAIVAATLALLAEQGCTDA